MTIILAIRPFMFHAYKQKHRIYRRIQYLLHVSNEQYPNIKLSIETHQIEPKDTQKHETKWKVFVTHF